MATPANLRWHPGVAKAHALVEVTAAVGTQILRSSHNIATVSIMSTGVFRVAFATAFSSQHYSPIALPYFNGVIIPRVSAASFPITEAVQSAAAFTLTFVNAGGTDTNPIAFSLVVLGDL